MIHAMPLSPDQQKELAKFPPALQALIEAELAAGNSIIEIGHSFPAPPVGAYVRLANKVSTRPRASADGIDFYDRNSSIYSGEFTDAKRFYFVLEPPNPSPPEPDMDAIRKEHEPKPHLLTRLAQRAAGSSVKRAIGESSSFPSSSSIPPETRGRERRRGATDEAAPVPRALTSTETPTGLKRILSFQDKRPPHEVQFALERSLMTLFVGAMDQGKLCLLAKANVNGARYIFELRFEAALVLQNFYSLCVAASWAEQPANSHDYFRKTSDSWFHLWTRDLMAASPPEPDAGSPERYRELAEAALQAETHLDSIAAIQQAIVTELKRGGSFATSHKEGGTNIFWRNGKFTRTDYGDYPDQQEFTDEAAFLQMLRQFCHADVRRNAGKEQLSDLNMWKLILRRLRKP
jgi:hypothetical protein